MSDFYVGGRGFTVDADNYGVRGRSRFSVTNTSTGDTGNVAGVRRVITRALNEGRKPYVLGDEFNKREAKRLYKHLDPSNLMKLCDGDCGHCSCA